MINKITSHIEEMHRRHVHMAVISIAVAASVGLYFVLPILLLAREIAMSTPVIHRFRAAVAENYIYPVPPPTAMGDSGQTVSPQPTPVPFVAGNPGADIGPGGKENPTMEEEFIDPREIKNVLNEIKKMKSEIKRFLPKLKKIQNVADDLQKITEINSQILEFEKNIANPSPDASIREMIGEFRDINFWDDIQAIRNKVELPVEIKRATKDLARVKKLAASKIFAKLGFDIDALKTRLNEMDGVLKESQEKYNAGDLEGAMDAMQDLRDNGQPGEIQGVMYGVRDIIQRTKGLRSKDIQAQVQEIINPVIESFNSGDYRDASMTLNEIMQSLIQLQMKMKNMRVLDEATGQKLEKLQQMVEEKLSNGGGAVDVPPEIQQPISTVPAQL
jgi:hypothetical protein